MPARNRLQYSLSFFSADALAGGLNPKYQLLIESAKLADRLGFAAVWAPERHFQTFGGLYGSPSVVGAALAVLTSRIKICAGSVVLPLNDPMRVAEEWAMIDNLSQGRVAVAFASGWHVNDFVLATPGVYDRRREEMYDRIKTVQQLWEGRKIRRPNGLGHEVEVGILPRPIQKDLPIWLTASSDDTFASAGRLGFNVLTSNFANRSLAILRRRIGAYREEIRRHHGRWGHVTMMVHSFTGASEEDVRAKALPALVQYLKTNMELQDEQDRGSGGGGGVTRLDEQQRREIIEAQAEQNMSGPLSFIGTLAACERQAAALYEGGVDELACLLDFGVSPEDTLMSVQRIGQLVGP